MASTSVSVTSEFVSPSQPPSPVTLPSPAPCNLTGTTLRNAASSPSSTVSLSENTGSSARESKYKSSPEETNNLSLWKWVKSCGAKTRKLVDGSVGRRQIYWCNQRQIVGCTATYYLDRGEHSVYQVIKGEHNHPPPTQSVTPAVWQKAKDQLASGLTPSKVHKNLILDCNRDESGVIPSKKQLSNWCYYQKRTKNALPSGDWLINLQQIIGVIHLTIIPDIRLIVATPEQLELLTTDRLIFSVNTTFDTLNCKLYLTTISGIIEGIPLPLAWFLHQKTTTQEYAFFLHYIQERTHNMMNPLAVLRDFDPAIEKAIRDAFPSAHNLGDYFHFVYDNQKWLRSNGGKDLVGSATAKLTTLWSAPTQDLWQQEMVEFVQLFEEFPSYVAYFTQQWTQIRQPVSWASFARQEHKQIPSADKVLEGYHRQLHALVLNINNQAIDHVVCELLHDWDYRSKKYYFE